MLETDVDEKYYLSDEQVTSFKASTAKAQAKGNGFKFEPIEKERERVAHAIATKAGSRQTDNFIRESWVEPQSALVQPVDRDYKKHGEERKTQVEMKKDGVSHALRTNGETLVVLPEVVEDFYKSRPARVYKGIAPTLRADRQGLKVAEPKIVARTDDHQKGGVYDSRSVSPTLTATTYKQPTQVAIKTANKTGFDIATDGDGIDLAYPQSATRRGRVGHGVAKTIPTSDSQGTLDGYRIRKLTPRECWRLMGFDDADFDKAQAVGTSNTQLYKQAGNSIVVNVLEAILGNLIKEK